MTVLLTYVKDIPDSTPQKFLTVTTNYGPCYKIFVTSKYLIQKVLQLEKNINVII